MRWLFLIMLVLNLSYIAWETLNASKKDALVNVPPLPDVPTILLVNEVGDEGALVAVVPVEERGQADTVGDSKQVVTASLENQTDVGMDKAVEDASSFNPVAKQTQASSTNNAEEDKSESESWNHSQDQAGKSNQLKVPDACFTLGPFRELDTLRALTRNIKEYVDEVGFRSRDEKEPSLFWVYLPPLKNKVQAGKIGKQLKAKKIKDFYIIRSGEKKNGISLGQFRNKGGAYRLAKKVTKLGFNVEVEPLFKTYTLYWLDYRLVDGNSIPDTLTAEYLAGKISRLSRSCESLPGKVF